MAQLVARLVRNEKVGGSNPPSSTTSKVCPARKLAGQTCFRGDFGQGIDAGVGEDAGGGLVGCVGGVLFVVDGDAGEQGGVEDASFCWFALVVEVVEVDQEFGELVESGSGVGVGVGEVVEPCADLVEAGADAVLLAVEEVEGGGVRGVSRTGGVFLPVSR